MHVTRKRDTYYAVVYAGRDADGKEHRSWMRLEAKDEGEANVEAKLRYGSGNDHRGPLRRIRLRDWTPQWLRVKWNELELASYQGYESYARRYTLPQLGHLYLDEITSWTIRLWQGWLTEQEGQFGPLSWKYRREIVLALKLAIGDASGEFAVHPSLKDVKPPTGPAPKVVPLTDAQGRLLLQETKGTWSFAAILLALMAGMRLGEIRALEWRDLDFEARTVDITRAMKRARAPGGESVGQPKTAKGVRVLDLNSWVVEELRSIHAETAAQFGDISSRRVLVGPVSGRPMRSGQFYKQYRRVALRLGISTRFHDLRHTHASQLLRAGVSIKVISARLGHASEAFTLRTYIHLLPGEAREAIRNLDMIYPAGPDVAA